MEQDFCLSVPQSHNPTQYRNTREKTDQSDLSLLPAFIQFTRYFNSALVCRVRVCSHTSTLNPDVLQKASSVCVCV